MMDEEIARFIRGSLDSRAKLEVALFLYQNRFTLESAAGLARRIGRGEEELGPILKEMAASHVVHVHGDPQGPRPCLYGYTQDGRVAKCLQNVAEAWNGPGRSDVLAQVLEGQAHAHSLRLRELHRLDSLKTQFLSMISHELRSPLTAIRGYIELLQANPDLDAAQRDLFLGTVAAQCERLGTTVNNVLMAAEMQHGDGWQGKCRPISLHEIITDLVEEISRAEPRRTFQLDLPPGLPPVAADETGVELVVRNLLDNAVKFSLDGSTIRIWLEHAGSEVHLFIGDEGVGISPDRLRAIFERFYQAEYYRTRRVGGAGLGLYLVKEVIEGMGGSIAVRSELGKGSVFTCVFAVAKEEPSAEEFLEAVAVSPEGLAEGGER